MRLWRMLIVAYVYAKFGDDRLWNEKALADRNNTQRQQVEQEQRWWRLETHLRD